MVEHYLQMIKKYLILHILLIYMEWVKIDIPMKDWD